MPVLGSLTPAISSPCQLPTVLQRTSAQLDFAVVTLAWADMLIPSMGNYSGLRSLRALRTLRTLRFLPGMPALVTAIFQSTPGLGSVAGLCTVRARPPRTPRWSQHSMLDALAGTCYTRTSPLIAKPFFSHPRCLAFSSSYWFLVSRASNSSR